MRIPKSWVHSMARRIVSDLLEKGYIEIEVADENLISATEELLLEELMMEDRLNEEVREILKEHTNEIEGKRLDYKRLFDLTKRKLVRERSLVL